jgi:hypothetical protein
MFYMIIIIGHANFAGYGEMTAGSIQRMLNVLQMIQLHIPQKGVLPKGVQSCHLTSSCDIAVTYPGKLVDGKLLKSDAVKSQNFGRYRRWTAAKNNQPSLSDASKQVIASVTAQTISNVTITTIFTWLYSGAKFPVGGRSGEFGI